MTLADNPNGFQGPEQQGRFLGQLLDTSPHAIIAYQAVRAPEEHVQPGSIIDMRTVFFNPAYERLFQEPAERIRHRSFRQRFTGQENTDLFPFYVQCLETGQGFRRERYYPLLGKWLDVSGTVSGDGFMVVLSDITERKTAELAAQQTNERLQAIINSVPVGINLLSPVYDSGGQLIDF